MKAVREKDERKPDSVLIFTDDGSILLASIPIDSLLPRHLDNEAIGQYLFRLRAIVDMLERLSAS